MTTVDKQPLTWGQHRRKRLDRIDAHMFSVRHTILHFAGVIALVFFW